MKIETGVAKIPIWMIWICFVVVLIAIFGWLYYVSNPKETKLVGFLGGVFSGLITYLLIFVTWLGPLRELERLKKMGIKGLLSNRHDKNYYHTLLENSQQRVDVMGVSCSRFVQDFLDPDADDKVLIDALGRHNQLRIRLMIPDDMHLTNETRGKIVNVTASINKLRNTYGDRIELRRFADYARHSFVIVDNELIAGPVFDGDKSRHDPAVHVTAETLFGIKYGQYFEKLWRESEAA